MSEDRILDFRMWIWEGIEHRERSRNPEFRRETKRKEHVILLATDF
jgi:hypothetical protein